MLSFQKKNFRFVAALILGLVLPVFLLPLLHFHPENSRNYSNQVNAYEHEAHFHSEVLEAYAHFINGHPTDPEQDKKYHKTHSSPDHDNDDVESYQVQKNVPLIKSILVVKYVDFPVYFEAPKTLISYVDRSETPTFTSLEIPRIHSSRSPPSISI